MKKRWLALPAICALILSACAGMAISDPALQAADGARSLPAPAAAEGYEAPEYEAIPFTSGGQVRAEDETVVAVSNYQTLLLGLRNEGALSPEDAQAAQRNIEAFNGKMRSVHGDLAEQGASFGEDALAAYAAFGPLPEEYEDDAEMEAEFCGDIVSAVLRRDSYTGGAHPNRYTASYLFDLAAGQFIDPTQIAEDPEAFRTGAAALLLEKAEAHPSRDGFWQDYAEILTRWNEGAVQFGGEGMRVTYSPYGLGPYAIGEVELSLDWEELEPLIGPSGMERLGKGEQGEK